MAPASKSSPYRITKRGRSRKKVRASRSRSQRSPQKTRSRGKQIARTQRKGSKSPMNGTHASIELLRSKGVGIILLVVVVFMSVSVVKEVIRRVDTRYEIDQLEAEVSRLEDRNTEMGDLIALFSTTAAQDKQARVKLGLQNPGEQVVLLPDRQDDDTIILPDSDYIEYVTVSDAKSNPQRWKHYLTEKISNTPEE